MVALPFMSEQLRLVLQADAHSFDDLINVVASALKDMKKGRLATNASAVGTAGYVYRTTFQSDQTTDLSSFLHSVVRQVAEAPSNEDAQRIARGALAITP